MLAHFEVQTSGLDLTSEGRDKDTVFVIWLNGKG
jgi:hypothetical protein